MFRVGILGATGRMGRLLIECLDNDSDAQLSCVYAREDSDLFLKDVIVTNDVCTLLHESDIIIDFSSKESTYNVLSLAIKHCPKPIVIGTTGLGAEGMALVNNASQMMPVLYSSNMSRGVFVLNKLVGITLSCIPDSDIEVFEMHHRNKIDSPSGTALKLAETCATFKGLSLDSVRVSSRDGLIGQRKKNEIGVMSLRGGDIVGKHTVGFYLDGEYIELTHNATSRMTFAKGALVACKWLYKQDVGLYSIEDAIGV